MIIQNTTIIVRRETLIRRNISHYRVEYSKEVLLKSGLEKLNT